MRRAIAIASVLVACGGGEEPSGEPDATTPNDDAASDATSEAEAGRDPCLCAPGTTKSCKELASTFGGGEAKCRASCLGYDTKACTRVEPRAQFELVRPSERDPRWSDARCNDGTSFWFGVRLSRSGNSKTWVVHLQGTGFCDDESFSCVERAKSFPDRVTGKGAADRTRVAAGFSGVFNPDPSDNGAFADANHVYAHYCSSDLWSGATAATRKTSAGAWYFSGRLLVRATVEALMQRFGLDDGDPATRVLLAGSSAGGVGAMINATFVAALLSKTHAGKRLVVVNDAGWLPDFEVAGHPLGNSGLPNRAVLAKAYRTWGAAIDEKCAAARKSDPGECFLGAVLFPFVAGEAGIPVLVQQNGLDPIYLAMHNYKPTDPERKKYYDAIVASLEKVDRAFVGGAMNVAGQPYHALLTDSLQWTYGPSGKTFREVLARFWERKPAEKVIVPAE